jgi:hypothetical protein
MNLSVWAYLAMLFNARSVNMAHSCDNMAHKFLLASLLPNAQ